MVIPHASVFIQKTIQVEQEILLMPNPQLTQFVQESIQLGATFSAIIPSGEIQVKENLAALCNGEYPCPNYGVAAGCPPHVEGPSGFRKWQAESEYAITVKIDIPTSVLFSHDRGEVMQLLHHIVSTMERKAVEAGYTQSRGFAGGSCKELFCDSNKGCSVIEDDKVCRHAEVARPSMSGFGIDVSHLMKTSGWPAPVADKDTLPETDEMSWVVGLILLG